MKLLEKDRHSGNGHHIWYAVFGVFLGCGILALAIFLIRKCRSASTSRHEYSALRCDSSERNRPERHTRDGTFNLYKKYLSGNDRYQLREHLSNLGSRADKHWFIVQDNSLGAKRLMTVVSLPSSCPLIPSTTTRDTLLSLFGGLQHPYIHPVLDMEFWDSGAALISPLNPTGSLRDLIYGTSWHESCDKKYGGRGEGLHLRQIQCLGRQILEALLFLHNRNFPPFYHLHSGNVIIQNGAARLAGLENTLFGLSPRCPGAPANLAFGYLLFEMTAGYELPSPPTPGHLELELERMPKVAEVLEVIFLGSRSPSLEELLCFDLFRGVELRELRGASGVQTRTSPDVMKLMDLVRCPVTIPPVRRLEFSDELDSWFA